MKTYISMILAILVLALVHLYVFTGSIGLKYSLSKSKVEFQKLYQENRRLNFILAQKESLNIIEEKAKNKLNMLYPEEMVYIWPTTGEGF